MQLLYTAAITLIVVMDPLGNIPIALTILAQMDPNRRKIILLRESFFAFLILTVFLFWGNYILEGLHITPAALRISGGIILFLIALKMIFPVEKDARAREIATEPFFVPIAIPLIAGPSAIATVILFATQMPDHTFLLFLALVIASLVSAVTLLFGMQLRRLLGRKGLIAIERLMGMMLTTIAVQMFLDGVQDYSKVFIG